VYGPLLLRTEIHRLTAQISVESLQHSRAGARHVLGCNAVAHLARDPRLLDIASRWLDATAIPFKATLFEKGPGANWLVSWHQDTALPMSDQHDVAGWGPWSTKLSHAGGVIAMRPLLVHASSKATVEAPRRVLHFEYAASLILESGLELRAA
jgi:hypothetical protein